MIAGEYDFVREQVELFGEEYVNALIESNFFPHYTLEQGWRWLLKSAANRDTRERV